MFYSVRKLVENQDRGFVPYLWRLGWGKGKTMKLSID